MVENGGKTGRGQHEDNDGYEVKTLKLKKHNVISRTQGRSIDNMANFVC